MQDDIYSATVQSHMQEFTLCPPSESWSAPGGSQFVDRHHLNPR